MLRFLASPRWIALTLFAVLMATLCVGLGLWQLDRLEGRRFTNARFAEGSSLRPEPVGQLVDAPAGGSLVYRRVTASGRYDSEAEIVLYGRALDGRPGNHVLTPLVLDDGRAVIVDRGWVPFEPTYPPIAGSAAPSGDVEVSGFLVADGAGGDDPIVEFEGGRITVVSRVDLQALQSQLPYELLPLSLSLQTQTPRQGDLPVPAPQPPLDDGPHLGYALQWFAFASIAVIGWIVLVRHEVLDRRKADAAD